MSDNSLSFDTWIRHDFVAINTELEELYFALDDPEEIDGVGDALKQSVRQRRYRPQHARIAPPNRRRCLGPPPAEET